jgi:hypothetical protein
MFPIEGHHAYLEEERKIPAWVLSDPRFADKIKIDRHRNAVFPHYNASGLCGYELKNRNFTGFAKGGEKGMWASAITAQDATLIIVEAAIDALSYHAIHRPENARYISMGGSLNPEQPVLIRAAIQRLPEGANLIIATDNDDGGDLLAEDIRRSAVEANRPDISAIEDRPEARGDDWNDVLRQDKPFTLKHSYRTALSHTPNAQRYSG